MVQNFHRAQDRARQHGAPGSRGLDVLDCGARRGDRVGCAGVVDARSHSLRNAWIGANAGWAGARRRKPRSRRHAGNGREN